MRENLSSDLQALLPSDTQSLLKTIGNKASHKNLPLYLVGGSVRDLLLGRPTKDLDLVVVGNTTPFAFEIAEELSGTVLTHSKFNTATITIGHLRLDLASARQENYEYPGALPQVTPHNIQEDLKRRDFTINSIAMSLSGDSFGTVLDPHSGLNDLKHRVIRVLHTKSFLDDSTRILRAIRYEQRLGFQLTETTQQLLNKALKKEIFNTISSDRIRRELQLTLEEPEPAAPLIRAGELGILASIYPPLSDVSFLRDMDIGNEKNQPLLYFAAIIYHLSPEEGKGLINRLNMPAQWAQTALHTISMKIKEPLLGSSNIRPSEVFDLIHSLSDISIHAVQLFTKSSQVKKSLFMYLNELRNVKPILTGNDILELGAIEGPQIGDILNDLHRAHLEREISTREEAIALAKKFLMAADCSRKTC